MSIYALKPRFQALLRPLVARLAALGVTANLVTVLAMSISIALGAFLTMKVDQAVLFLLLPAWMFLRMALNAIDGMLAREFGQKSAFGAFLNEISDVVADSFLFLPFAYLPHFDPLAVGAVIVLAVISEMAGTVAVMVGASRRYDGPFGKSDRAFVFGILALAIGFGAAPHPAFRGLFPVLAFLLGGTIVNRVRRALEEIQAQ